MRNYDMRYLEGDPPTIGSENGSSTTTLWVRHHGDRDLDFASLSAISDVFYPASLPAPGTGPAGRR